MKPTPGPWTYNRDFGEVRGPLGTDILAITKADEPFREDERENDVNGYLMASAPYLRDELTNLSHAVRAYFLARESGADMPPDEAIAAEMQALDQMEVMLQRAEQALETIFPLEHES